MNQYEAMFLFDPTFGNSFEKCEAEIRRLMERAQGEIIHCRKWDERRLAYRINGRKRGVYVLVYFKAPPQSIAGMERDAKLDENILRLLVLRADHLSPEDMERTGSAREEAQSAPDEETDSDQDTDDDEAEVTEFEAVETEQETTTAPKPAAATEMTKTVERVAAPEGPEPYTGAEEPAPDEDDDNV